jgi:tryptophanyl-tRNA synthetase
MMNMSKITGRGLGKGGSERIDPWKSIGVKNYEQLMKNFGIEPFEPILKKLKNPHLLMKRGIIFGHRGFDLILKAIKKKEDFAMMTGLMPSGKFHFGHMILAQQMIYYQQLGAQLFICVADIEAYNMRKIPMEKLRETAIEEYLVNYIALGLKPKNCDFYFQSNRNVPYYRLISMLGRRTTLNELKDVYGDISPAKIVSVLTQVGDIFHPQLEEYGGPKPVVVPVGIDQDPHIRLTRDIAQRVKNEFKFFLPSATYHKLLPGLKGGKMSSSDPLSYISLTDSPDDVKTKIMKYAFSGGGNNIEEHRKYGGNTDVDVSFQYLRFIFEPDDKKLQRIKEDYESGKMLTGELKSIVIEKIQKFLIEHQKKREKARDRIHLFLKN